jgi:hypothetical protein
MAARVRSPANIIGEELIVELERRQRRLARPIGIKDINIGDT